MRAEATTGGQGVIPDTPHIHTVSPWRGKGQHKTKPRGNRTSKQYQRWNRREIAGTVPASSTVTGEEIQVTILGERLPCPECGYMPQWDGAGDLICNCRIWSGPNVGQEPRKQQNIDAAIQKEKRNQNYQRNMRQFFKKGGR